MRSGWLSKFLTMFVVVMMGMTLMSTEALAKRMGSGSNAGMQRSVAPPAAPAANKSATAPAAAAAGGAATAASGRSWMGPLMGFAAGGLLAAMLMGGGFEGIGAMDIVVLLLLVAGAYFFLRRRAASAATAQGSMDSAAPAYEQRRESVMTAPSSMRDVAMGSRVGEAPVGVFASTSSSLAAPAWFDESAFIGQAKGWFVRLQAAWDASDFTTLSAIVTPDFLEELKVMRVTESGETQTRVDEVNAQVVAWSKEGDQWVLTVRFTGYIAEEKGSFPHAFSEYWHLIRLGDAMGEWRLAGIQQEV